MKRKERREIKKLIKRLENVVIIATTPEPIHNATLRITELKARLHEGELPPGIRIQKEVNRGHGIIIAVILIILITSLILLVKTYGT